ncbi:Fe(3+)-hydroxamate ABC transporter permease FhuB [Grimontia kaedaensis]|uniref:Fe(3+)-hydroxamate ABC transporter permease FhuB n=1 Tax=Grimontia kaedaensis TaxID=2872157 RepID=A0ABY4WXD0_9GAMM|nr:Fe(3+)-hydroxamate ABC transporter permease FhuB [Grimontia kaedaensis]USH03640.1 Fe(3+)-hydroxamate ABC transporter permease FhuB [Grimontia kaedaensis]
MKRWGYLMAAFIGAALLHLGVGQHQFGSVGQLYTEWFNGTLDKQDSFEWLAFVEASLPRLMMAITVGGALGLVGSLFQQLTQNRMMSPLTFGTSSGAWLGLVLLSILAPSLAGDYSLLMALLGALLAMVLVVTIVGINNLSGIPIVLAGMAVNLLLGAIATAIILLNDQYAQNLFVWGAGDLGQNGWEVFDWLLIRLTPIFLLIFFAPRVLQLLSIGGKGAAARGLNVSWAFFLLISLGVWLAAVSITAVGVISFVGLIAPNIARYIGFTRPRTELVASFILGAAFLALTDTLATYLGQWSLDMIPTGTATAVIGTPALVILARRRLSAQDQLSLTLPTGPDKLKNGALQWLGLAMTFLILLSVFWASSPSGYALQIPDGFEWTLKWPRLLTAIASGISLAVAGVVLQRLVFNPLASPDILGVSAGAVLALVLASLVFGYSIHGMSPWVAMLGSVGALVVLLFLGKKHEFAPSILILTGLSLTALLEALVQFTLTRVGDDKYVLLGWLSGSTYRVESNQAITLVVCVAVSMALVLVLSRWITLISSGRQFAAARGLNLNLAYITLLILVAFLCAIVTTTMGPVSFVGLLAPHIAVMLGARQVTQQIYFSGAVGAVLLLLADFLGQIVVYPAQISAGTLVSVLGGSYFIYILVRNKSIRR